MKSQPTMVIFGGGDASPAAVEFAIEGMALARQRRPRQQNVVIIPIAKYTLEKYRKAIDWAQETFTSLGGVCQVLTSFEAAPVPNAGALLEQADLLYIPGGNTDYTLKYLAEHNLIAPIMAAINRGAVVVGVSAGLIIWFESACTASNFFLTAPGEPWSYDIRPALGILPGCCCPHGDDDVFEYTHQPRHKGTGFTRRQDFQTQLKHYSPRTNGLAIDNFTALRLIDGMVTVLGNGKVTLHLWQNDQLFMTEHSDGDQFALSVLRD